jgi:protocatechuate 3,4-dioxygenase beta subunit
MAISRRKLMQTLLAAGGAAAAGAAGCRFLGEGEPLPREPFAPGPGASAQGAARRLPPTPACADGDDLEPTLSATPGPFYKPSTPERTDLRDPGTVGAPLVIAGRVLTTDCRPVPRALLDVWSADGNGRYDNQGYRLRGHLYTGRDGTFRLHTVKPGSYGDYGGRRTPHIHLRLQGRDTRLLTTQLFFPGEPLNASDGLFQRSLQVDLTRDGDLLVARYDFVLG